MSTCPYGCSSDSRDFLFVRQVMTRLPAQPFAKAHRSLRPQEEGAGEGVMKGVMKVVVAAAAGAEAKGAETRASH